MLKPRKLVFVYDCIYPFVKGGAEKRFYEMGKRLAASGYNVHWYGMKFWEGSNTLKHDGIILHGLCKARPIYTKAGRRSISQAMIFGFSTFKLLFVDFDIIDCCGFPYFSLFPTKLATLIRRKPLFATWHEVWGKDYWREYLGILGIVGYWTEVLATKLPNSIIAVSQHTANLLKGNFNITCSAIIPNGIDIKFIESVSPNKQASDLIYVGRLVDFKNVDMIIEALAYLKKEAIELKCAVIGDGPAKNGLHKLAEKRGVTSQINWLGLLENKDVYAHIKASKVFVLPSRREGFGIVALEANACGKPAMIANFSGNGARDLILTHENGYVFEPVYQELALTLKEALRNYKNFENGAINFAHNYDWGQLTKKQLKAYAV